MDVLVILLALVPVDDVVARDSFVAVGIADIIAQPLGLSTPIYRFV